MICPYCREGLDQGPALACDQCATAVHADCATLHGRCVVFGCPGGSFATLVPDVDTRRTLDPALPVSVLFRRAVRTAVAVTIAPLELAEVVGLAGAAALLLL